MLNVAKISTIDYSDRSWQKSQNQKEREVTNLTNLLRPFIRAYSFVDSLFHFFTFFLLRYSNEELSNFSVLKVISQIILLSQGYSYFFILFL